MEILDLPEIEEMNPLQLYRSITQLMQEYYEEHKDEIKRLEAEEQAQ